MAAFAIDWGVGPGGIQSPAGHRDNMMSADFREVGTPLRLRGGPGLQLTLREARIEAIGQTFACP